MGLGDPSHVQFYADGISDLAAWPNISSGEHCHGHLHTPPLVLFYVDVFCSSN